MGLQTPFGHFLGYDPVRARQAKALLRAGPHFRVTSLAPDHLPDAISLTSDRRRPLEQGQAGTCWVHAPTQLTEFTMIRGGYNDFDVCRRLIGYYGKQLEGGGNPSNGGSGIDALAAMTGDKGKGIAHESLCPYTDNAGILGQRPPQNVLDDASKSHLTDPVDVSGLDETMTMIASAKTPVCVGIWWTYSWDQQEAIHTTIGPGEYGHELLVCGYAKPGVLNSEQCWQLDNWHGRGLYPTLTSDQAAKIVGYKPISPSATSDFWVTDSIFNAVINKGNAEFSSAADIQGLAGGNFYPVNGQPPLV